MALQLKDNTYLKIDADGNYIIYKNKTARNKEKKISSQEIIDKYISILNDYNLNAEIVYYAPEIVAEYKAWKEEYDKYIMALQYKDTNLEFPLMSKYFPDIKNSLPIIIERGGIGVPSNKSVKEIYQYIKELEIFGPIEEVKDV